MMMMMMMMIIIIIIIIIISCEIQRLVGKTHHCLGIEETEGIQYRQMK